MALNLQNINTDLNEQSSTKSQINSFQITASSVVSEKNAIEMENDYQEIKKLGQGSYGEVHKVMNKINKKYRARKTIKKETIATHKQNEYLNELKLLKQLDHPYILKVYEAYEYSDKISLITELCEGGDLFDSLQEGPYEEKDAAMVMKQLLSALQYAHDLNIVHRDLKSENIMIDLMEEDNIIIKVIDWGGAGRFTKDSQLKRYIGTIHFMAPEIIEEKKYNGTVDIWSSGVILYELLSENVPFFSENKPQIIERIKNNEFIDIMTSDTYEQADEETQKKAVDEAEDIQIENSIKSGKFTFPEKFFEGVGDLAKDLIKKMLTLDPQKRPSAKECLQHPWFLQFQKKNDQNKDKMKKSLSKMRSFEPSKILQKWSLKYISTHLISKEEEHSLRDIFNELDTNNDGVIQREELVENCRKFLIDESQNVSDKEAEEIVDNILKSVDSDNSGSIQFSEFLTANIKIKSTTFNNNLKQAFQLFDKEKKGKINIQNLKDVLGKELQQQLKEQQEQNGENKIEDQEEEIWKHILDEADENGDQEIDFLEFKAMMNNFVDKFYTQSSQEK